MDRFAALVLRSVEIIASGGCYLSKYLSKSPANINVPGSISPRANLWWQGCWVRNWFSALPCPMNGHWSPVNLKHYTQWFVFIGSIYTHDKYCCLVPGQLYRLNMLKYFQLIVESIPNTPNYQLPRCSSLPCVDTLCRFERHFAFLAVKRLELFISYRHCVLSVTGRRGWDGNVGINTFEVNMS